MVRDPRPDFLLIGAPKAGTTALHAALAQHPGVFVTDPKEPKYYLCADAPPPDWCGPGDRHSQREWVWRHDDYRALFEPAAPHQVRGESTPFYLWSRDAHRRIADALPDVRLVAVVRDPVDRAYSNWMHLWSDGLEKEPDFERAFALQDERVDAGWAPFWRYRELGMYGEQLSHLTSLVDPARVLVVRYREIVDDPVGTVDRVCRFVGVEEGQVETIPRDNSKPYAPPGWRTRVLGPVVRGGAALGRFAEPEVWRRASAPLIRQLSGSEQARRPQLTPEQRGRLVEVFADDVRVLGEVTGEDYTDWLSTADRGSFEERAAAASTRPGRGRTSDQRTTVTRSCAPSGRAAST